MSLKHIRTRRNWSQEELAQVSGLSVRTIQRMERDHKPALESEKALAAAFDIDLKELRDALSVTSSDEENKEVQANNIIQFLSISAGLIFVLIFPLASALQDPSNWGAFWAMCAAFAIIIGFLAWDTFNTFLPSLKDKIISKL